MINTVVGGGAPSLHYGSRGVHQHAEKAGTNASAPAGRCDTLPSGGVSFTKMIGKLLLEADQNSR